MNPGLDPLDPLELALLMEAAEDLGDLNRDDPPPGEVGAEDGGQDEMPLPRRYIKQILRAYDRGGRRAASRMGQRAVARGVVRALLGRRRA
jgi:hypothetical protein